MHVAKYELFYFAYENKKKKQETKCICKKIMFG